ncbi:MAG: hypothetical protein Q9M92_07980 [Enterobacterales bacterium]|nr:hypothetical protein [Enterobacterales bacterium]
MKSSKSIILVVCVSLLTLFSLFSGFSTSANSQAGLQCQLISRADAIRQAHSQVKGKVVGVQLSKRGNRSVYRVRMLTDNKRVKTISIPACR